MNDATYMTPAEVDSLFRWPRGRAKRLARADLIRHIRLPDGDVRFERNVVEQILTPRGGVQPVAQIRLAEYA